MLKPRKNKSYQAHASTLVETLKTRRVAVDHLRSQNIGTNVHGGLVSRVTAHGAVAARLLQVTKEFKDALEDSADDRMQKVFSCCHIQKFGLSIM